MRMAPAVMSASPTIMRSTVDCPEPDGPTMIMNSPSLISRLSSLTAAVPSGNRRVMLSSWMSAMALSLHGSGCEARHDAPLEEEDRDDHGDGDDHGGRCDLSRGLLELRGALEEGDRRRDGPRPDGGGERDREQEVVPGEDEREDGGGEHARRGKRHDAAPGRLERCGAGHFRRLPPPPWNLAEGRRPEPERPRP